MVAARIAPSLARRARRLLLKERFREALRLQERERELREQESASRREVELPEPVRAGWERYFTVRPDLQKSPEGPYLDRILSLVQRRETSNRRDFAQRDWEHGNKMVPRAHRLKEIEPATYWILTPKMREHFVPAVHRSKYRGRTILTATFSVAHEWKFVSRMRPYWLTHQVVYDCDTKSDQHWIDTQLNGPADFKIRHLLKWRGGWSKEYPDGPEMQEPLIEVGPGRWEVDTRRAASELVKQAAS